MAREIRRTRETWVDTAKVLACILVVLGHFYQSMIKANIVDYTTTYTWFNRTIYYFHVPLFFLCSGYLYQQGKPVQTMGDWQRNVLKKLVTLGIPFLIFASANWLVNGQSGSLAQKLFVKPAAPYWYLYILFFMFLVTPTINKTMSAFILGGIAVMLKGITLTFGSVGVYILDTFMSYWLWFVIGMLLSFIKAPKALRKQKSILPAGIAMLILFFAGSIAVVTREVSSAILSFIFGVLGCSAVVILAISTRFTDSSRKVIRWMSDYTMPVYLMHTIFAAGLRSALLKFGVTDAIVHVAAGLVITFAGPILVGFILKKLKWAEFIIYPGNFIKFGSKKEEMSHSKKA